MDALTQLVILLDRLKEESDKDKICQMVVSAFHLRKDRKVYDCKDFAIRFSYSSAGGFSNTVISLSALRKYDDVKPFLVYLVLARENNRVYLANTTMLKKVSHSSKELQVDNIRGSINGSDIIKNFENAIPNDFKHIHELWQIHQEYGFEGNIERLVEATHDIHPRLSTFEPSDAQLARIYSAPVLAKSFLCSPGFVALKREIDKRVYEVQDAIFVAAHIENVNIRGRIIERLITLDAGERRSSLIQAVMNRESLDNIDTHNNLGDYESTFEGLTLKTDIKTKVLYLASMPKAYNVDKFLEFMAEGGIFLFYFLGIGRERIENQVLCSVFQPELIDEPILLSHWAGRNRRGSIQFRGEYINRILKGAPICVDVEKARSYLDFLLQTK